MQSVSEERALTTQAEHRAYLASGMHECASDCPTPVLVACACGHIHSPDRLALIAGHVICRCDGGVCWALVLSRWQESPMA